VCGIVGAFNPQTAKVAAPEIIKKMRDCLARRGPDGTGIWRSHDGSCALAHRRLAIIDLNDNAAQPMGNSDQTVVVVFNGEIYNHKEIRLQLERLGKYRWRTDHSDTEVLLHAYQEWGIDCADKFYGMFSFAIYDSRNRGKPVLHLLRDRMGVKPLYIAQTKHGEWLFASEIKALFMHPEISPEMDSTAFGHYLTFVVAPAPLTMFKGIFKIPAGWRISIDYSGLGKAHQWYDKTIMTTDRLRETDISEDQAAAQLLSLLRTSISRRMIADVPFGVLLSGGVDSSLIVALMAEQMDRPVTTFSVGYENEPDYNEFDQVRMVAQKFSTRHFETAISATDAQNFLPEMVRLQDEPVADNVCIPLYFLSAFVRQHNVPVVQVGEGADEHFLGYWWCAHYRDLVQQSTRHKNPVIWLKSQIMRMRGHTSDQVAMNRRLQLNQPAFWGGAVSWWGPMRDKLTPQKSSLSGVPTCPVEGLLPKQLSTLESQDVVVSHMQNAGGRNSLGTPSDAILSEITYLEQRMRIPEHLLMRVDKMTMAHGIEARVPFLDHDVVEFAGRLPLSYKLKGNVGKYILKKAAAGLLDASTITRKKQGFGAPMDKWLREPAFAKRCQDVIDRSRLVADGLIDGNYLNTLMAGHKRSASGYGAHIWTVLNAMIWHDYWVEGHENCF